MTPKFKTRDVAKSLYTNYLKRAEECFHAAKNSFNSQEWNAATINAIHACIAGCDAMCVYFLGRRHAGESHNETATLFKTIDSNDESINTNANRVARILSVKNFAEYEDRLVHRSEAEKVVINCGRFLEYIKTKLPK